MEGIESLKTAVAKTFTEEAWSDFADLWTPYSVKRKEIITAAGSTEKYLYYITEGVQRIYYTDDQDREATLIFTYAPSFGGIVDSFLLQQPSRYAYESLTRSAFLRAPVEGFKTCMNNHVCVADVINRSVVYAFSGLLERMVELQCFSSEDKFRSLLKRSPHILTLVPHKYLANYLGIDPTNFSKLINSIRID
jgi:CRP-like cAMP-binding protein